MFSDSIWKLKPGEKFFPQHDIFDALPEDQPAIQRTAIIVLGLGAFLMWYLGKYGIKK